ncbi:MAG: ArgR family transcriptional regulator [Acidobacteriota bacterium]|nr:ArgR family transcriptional regulator [Acidobacteriota bacterium]
MGNLYRRNQILEILGAKDVTTQSELRGALAQRGIRVTQATVSRDIEELGLVKTREGYHLPGAQETGARPQPTLAVVLKEFLREVKLASSLVVVRTHPGNAHTVAVALDSTGWPELAGTVAGDDTIFLATARPRDAALVRKKILDALGE